MIDHKMTVYIFKFLPIIFILEPCMKSAIGNGEDCKIDCPSIFYILYFTDNTNGRIIVINVVNFRSGKPSRKILLELYIIKTSTEEIFVSGVR